MHLDKIPDEILLIAAIIVVAKLGWMIRAILPYETDDRYDHNLQD